MQLTTGEHETIDQIRLTVLYSSYIKGVQSRPDITHSMPGLLWSISAYTPRLSLWAFKSIQLAE